MAKNELESQREISLTEPPHSEGSEYTTDPERDTKKLGAYRNVEHHTVAQHVGTVSRTQNDEENEAGIGYDADVGGYVPTRPVAETGGGEGRRFSKPPTLKPVARQNTMRLEKSMRSGTMVMDKDYSSQSQDTSGGQKAAMDYPRADASDSKHGYAVPSAHRPESGRGVETRRVLSAQRGVDLGRASEQGSSRPGEVRRGWGTTGLNR
jgi:hypothetical protein